MTSELKQQTGAEWFEELCRSLEHYETPAWAAKEIFNHELMTLYVFDPCTGTGILARAASEAGHDVGTMDIQRWEGMEPQYVGDFLTDERAAKAVKDATVFMNPPFSKAEEFVERALVLGARKVVCFQRLSWWESEGRSWFWHKNPPNRIYVCGSRATCWRHDVPPEKRVDAKGRPKTTPTAHAWFIWEKGQPRGTQLGHIYKQEETDE